MFGKLFLVLLSAFSVALATTGVDVSQRTPLSDWQCAKNYGYNFGIVRVYMSTGHPDSNGPANIKDAWNSGMAHVDGYIFPCYSCGNAAGQMDATVNYLASNGISMLKEHERIVNDQGLTVPHPNATLTGTKYGMLWIDVEGTQYWSSNQQSNVNFISEMASRGQQLGVSIGVYTSNSQWSPITGGSHALSSYPLWYPHYDSNPSFSDFSSFGGWSKPAIKQYVGDASFCSAGWDKNYY